MRYSRRFLRFVLGVLPSSLGLLLFTACDSRPPAHMTDPGQLIYLGYTNPEANCSRCHGEEGQGGMFGPKIRGVLQKRGAEFVRETIRHGKGEDDDRMPALAEHLSAEQIEQVLRFLSTWSDSGKSP